jgi:hypothetical protein
MHANNYRKIYKHAVHNVGQGVAILAHFYKINWQCNACLDKWTPHRFSKLLWRSISAFPGKRLKLFSLQMSPRAAKHCRERHVALGPQVDEARLWNRSMIWCRRSVAILLRRTLFDSRLVHMEICGGQSDTGKVFSIFIRQRQRR